MSENTVKQCKSCPWRVGCVPDKDIPRGPGNNIGVRMGVLTGRYPVPEVDGDQHERFEDTLPQEEDDGA